MGEFNHVSVMLNEAVDGLNIKPNGIYVDGTTGGAGHSNEIQKALNKEGRLICIDRDTDALNVARTRLSEGNVTFVHDNYKNLDSILKLDDIKKIDGCLFDLGVSSYQLDEESRGFSYMKPDAPLDMRMDTSKGITAADILNTYDAKDLIRVFRDYGEEKFASKIANNIVSYRDKSLFKATGDLTEIIEKSVPKNQKGGHPAKRVFQALRIEVNEELSGLYEFLTSLPNLLNDKGRIVVITFHSLEDRIVKNAFRNLADPCICPKEFPICTCGKKPSGRIITRKPILPSEEEISKNSRSKSAKLRIFEKLDYEG